MTYGVARSTIAHSILARQKKSLARWIPHLHLRVADSHAGESVLRNVAACVGCVALTGYGVHLVQPSLRLLPAGTHQEKVEMERKKKNCQEASLPYSATLLH